MQDKHASHPPLPTTRKPFPQRITQFSIFSDNKVGRLNDLVRLLAENDLHFIALASVDMIDSSIIRIIVNYPEAARTLFKNNGHVFREAQVIAVQIDNEHQLSKITCALVQAEMNIHYLYPFLMRPNGKTGLVLRVEDNDLAEEILKENQVQVLNQDDIAR
ncbi:MAG: hypothetical protein B7X06_02015 [Verrucomicrobia bacterium 21-51-4]|nr:MAG: hypothetical protein B7X06_02015 [Verrucomicrobia bacterium 21-51-4]HQU09065.1 acetolactate synthase [Opitutales bacterium]